jgi:hypothetical protein
VSFSELAGLVTFRPLSTPLPEATYDGTYRSPFTAKWSATVELLAREVRHLRPRQALLELDIAERDFRIDGLPKANARQNSPGVILTLVGTPHGDLRYPCHTFHHWEDNVRGIALALEALRKVDRYGVTKRGEQYTGWAALPAGDGDLIIRGQRLIREHGTERDALMATHPDRGGDADDFRAVKAAVDAARG